MESFSTGWDRAGQGRAGKGRSCAQEKTLESVRFGIYTSYCCASLKAGPLVAQLCDGDNLQWWSSTTEIFYIIFRFFVSSRKIPTFGSAALLKSAAVQVWN